jgi:hypothetical protein
MALFPQRYFTQDQVAIRTGPPTLRAPYKAAEINAAFSGQPKGAYRGFVPSVLGSVVSFGVGPEGYSIAKVDGDAQGIRGGLDIKVNSTVSLDFSAALPGDFAPNGIQVILRAIFLEGQETVGQIFARSKTVTQTVHTVGATPATFDLSTLQLDGIEPGSLGLFVDVDSFGLAVISDPGTGVLAASVGLPMGGTIDYALGTLTGITAILSPLSTVILTYTRTPQRDEVLLCSVTGTPGAPVVTAVAPVTRDVPIAYPTVPFGYMLSGSIELLAAAVLILTEVAAARTDLQGTPWPNLKARLDYDLSGEAMGLRLGRIFRAIRSNQYQAASGVTEINVSGSFSAVNRDFLPAVTLNGNGSESQTGVLADPIDTVRNTSILIDADTGDRLVDNTTDRNVVFGRVHQEPDFILDGQITFTLASTVVVGDSVARFTLQLQAGDTVQGPDGKFYEVLSIANSAALTLRDAYQGANATSGALIRRRFKLRLRKLVAGVESAHTMAAVTQIQAYLPTFLTHATAAFDAGTFVYKPGERPTIPDATTSVQGKIALASAGSPFVGSINLQDGGVPVAGGPFHTLNFVGASGALVELSPGVIDVTNTGPIGPPGPGGGPGPTGPPGVTGTSLNQITRFSNGLEAIAFGPGTVPVSHTVNFGYTVKLLSGGISTHRDQGIFVGPNDYLEITDIDLTGPTTGTIVGFLGFPAFICDAVGRFYLDACGTT